MTDELKPCPFCGNATPKLIVAFEPLKSAFVDCKCGATSPIFETGSEATTAWNCRTPAVSAEPVAYRVGFEYKNALEEAIAEQRNFPDLSIEPLYATPAVAGRDATVRDAARYEWVRVPGNHFRLMSAARWNTPEQFDAAIDAAMKAKP